ncbi:hypothetical protein [Bacteriovorax sp. Seq25_V]|uniref:hypothetical protein n=1 Tax=Bacteriovorax sp. Seq25_V TaxID=1201288 RepID=UPI00038A4EAE|nr:hypothetical protein [Bacteriovorax sp. Seq25_V]EQC45326.1 hypothetical protein M900_1848 [Bacteriovorax sp. Seq25_V]
MKNKFKQLAQAMKKMRLGKVETVDLKKEFNFDDGFEYVDIAQNTADDYTKKRKISAYASYATTSGCSDSCGSSTNCC